MKLVVGLGNPGRKYEHTRHNVGFAVLDELARRAGVSFRRSWRFPADLAETSLGGATVLLVKPRTYMNRSGEAVGPLARKKGAGPGDVVVVVDDMDLDAGRLRLRPGGSSGGHNGLKSIAEHLGTEAYARVRVGVGRPQPGEDRVGFVLGSLPPGEREAVREAIGRAADAVAAVIERGCDRAMNDFNG